MPSESSTHPCIAILGGGLGGLALLLTLHRRGVHATLYERDVGFNARAHLGGSLDLGWESGQCALRENGLQEEFDKNSRPEGEEMRIYDGAGKLHHSHGEGGPSGPEGDQDLTPPQGPEDIRPEIDRTVLRKILLDAIPPHLIKWDHPLTSVRPLGNGQHELTFANGFTTVSDFLVGADGANSRVRPLLSPATPIYTGVNGVEISLAPETTKLPELQETVANIGKGMMMALQDSCMLGSQVNGDGRIRTYVYLRESADWSVPSDPAEAKAVLKRYFDGWPQWMLNLIDYADESAIYPRTLYILPVGHSWPHVRGVTLIGDAAHLMSPFAGAGANLALLDGLELGLVLAELAKAGKLADLEAVDKAVAAFEEKMCALAGRVADKAERNLHAFIHPDAPQSTIRQLQQLMTEGPREG
ncbi:monooxygenase [Dichomitus squalens LYAD-421 SS1]|uniref:Monooxygenase n=1 Tax=Dichomitus squalens (strain LYAD-421) TaxID=732165 RepID=R7SQP8_DICSQ|nr:monooxygenase [Dichomitus squalens LYAD-421 SS1]EJF58085.1 monooxygenase [Dichomitus squalens LYAD-421 SS1]